VSTVDESVQTIEEALRSALSLAQGCPPRLQEAMAYSLLAPGKRFRPRLVMLGCRSAGGAEVMALPAAAAVEMVHAYSLIHDDLPAMDDDDLRRGRSSCHKVYGEAVAILAGDALLTLAFQVLAENYAPVTASACCRELAAGAGPVGMVGGQVLDLYWENREDGEVADLEAVHAAKTGALLRAAVRMGASVALGEQARTPEPPVLAALDLYGRAIGLLFQVTDDLLDVEGETHVAGKRLGKDAGRGKLTYPGLLGVAESRRRADELCHEAVAAVEPLGPAAGPLTELARSIRRRDR